MTAQEVIEHAVCESLNAINPGPLAMSLNVLLSSFNPPDCCENLEVQNMNEWCLFSLAIPSGKQKKSDVISSTD